MRTWSKSPKRYLFLILFLASLVLISCTQETELLPRVWVDSPREGAAISSAQPVLVHSHAFARAGIAEVVLSVDGQPYTRSVPVEEGADFSEFQQEWLPPGDGTYILQLVAYDHEGVMSNPATLTVRIGEISVVESVPDDSTITPVVEQVSICPPEVTAKTNSYCRSGPGEVYPELTILSNGETASVSGQSEDGYWWVIDRPDTSGTCWIWEELVTISTDTCTVAIVDTPLPPQDNQAPPVPSPQVPANGLSLTCRSTQNLVWLPVEDQSGIAGYTVKLEEEISPGNWQSVNRWETIQGKQVQVPVECGIKHRWAVRAADGVGNRSSWSAYSNFIVELE